MLGRRDRGQRLSMRAPSARCAAPQRAAQSCRTRRRCRRRTCRPSWRPRWSPPARPGRSRRSVPAPTAQAPATCTRAGIAQLIHGDGQPQGKPRWAYSNVDRQRQHAQGTSRASIASYSNPLSLTDVRLRFTRVVHCQSKLLPPSACRAQTKEAPASSLSGWRTPVEEARDVSLVRVGNLADGHRGAGRAGQVHVDLDGCHMRPRSNDAHVQQVRARDAPERALVHVWQPIGGHVPACRRYNLPAPLQLRLCTPCSDVTLSVQQPFP